MLLVVTQKARGGEKLVVSKIKDDTAIEQALDLLKGVMSNNRLHAGFIYSQQPGSRPVLIKKLTKNWYGKLKIR